MVRINRQMDNIMEKILLKDWLKKQEQEEPLCNKCDVELKFDYNLTRGEKGFREGHHDGYFNCKVCKEEYVILDYKNETKN